MQRRPVYTVAERNAILESHRPGPVIIRRAARPRRSGAWRPDPTDVARAYAHRDAILAHPLGGHWMDAPA